MGAGALVLCVLLLAALVAGGVALVNWTLTGRWAARLPAAGELNPGPDSAPRD